MGSRWFERFRMNGPLHQHIDRQIQKCGKDALQIRDLLKQDWWRRFDMKLAPQTYVAITKGAVCKIEQVVSSTSQF